MERNINNRTLFQRLYKIQDQITNEDGSEFVSWGSWGDYNGRCICWVLKVESDITPYNTREQAERAYRAHLKGILQEMQKERYNKQLEEESPF